MQVKTPSTAIANIASQGDGTNGTQLCAFIELYGMLPELWNPANPSYLYKHKKYVALDKLLVVYKEIKPAATRDDVRKKLNSLRTNFRKELKKIESSKRSGSGSDDVYKPNLWVFHALTFLHTYEQPVNVHRQWNEVSTK
ncbi:hypothetical protein PR048_014471 [Dryococelus australis]|uniref:MADF domain-containing protein n=1 Tax=Dryococelus australis TaxID=614101 RepID=A0ABQ9HEC6_9NEOP|nr:hypothetical protein PR048_014471 [Dryococelus australis]